MSEGRPEALNMEVDGPGLASAARRTQADLLEALAVAADSIADDLADRLGMVAWEREEQIGLAQRRVSALSDGQGGRIGGAPIRIRERREQPLEALELAWRGLRQGRPVHVESEAGACPAVYRILRDMAELLGTPGLTVSAPGRLDHPRAGWESGGVEPHAARVALVQADADLELAAHVLARACLRRTGFDPRVVHQVITVGAAELLERNLRRLWVGARMGLVDDDTAFAGPVDDARAVRFLDLEASWRARTDVSVVCPGGRLLRPGPQGRQFLAPALFRAAPGAFEDGRIPELLGPMLLLRPVEAEGVGGVERAAAQAEALLAAACAEGRDWMRFGVPPRGSVAGRRDRQIHGALLAERLPPGLPEPRP